MNVSIYYFINLTIQSKIAPHNDMPKSGHVFWKSKPHHNNRVQSNQLFLFHYQKQLGQLPLNGSEHSTGTDEVPHILNFLCLKIFIIGENIFLANHAFSLVEN